MISITAVNEHQFKGYTLQGKAKIIPKEDILKHLCSEWEKRVTSRITNRIARSVKVGSKSQKHFEACLPVKPKYLIEVNVQNIVDLAPPSRKK